MEYVILNLPSPPKLSVSREWAGTFGVGFICKREDYGHQGCEVFPNWMAYSASAMKFLYKKYAVVDGQAENLNKSELIKRVGGLNPKVIITLISQPSYDHDKELISALKKGIPGVRIAVLGGIVNAIYDKVKKEVEADVFIRGFYPFFNETVELIKNPKKKELECTNTINPLDRLELSVYPLFKMDKYRIADEGHEYFALQNATGCPYSCPYCPYPISYGSRVHYKSVQKAIEEMEYLKENHGFNAFLLKDVVFGLNRKRSKELLDEMVKRKLGVKIFFETRADVVSDDFLSLAKEAGCVKIDYGLESGSEKILSSIAKPGLTLDTVKKAISMTKRHGIIVNLHLLIGLPGEDANTIKETIKFIKEANPDSIDCNILTPYVGTSIYKMLSKNEMIVEKDWSKYTSFNAVTRTEKMSPRRLAAAKRKIERSFKIHKILSDKRYRQSWMRRKLRIGKRGGLE